MTEKKAVFKKIRLNKEIDEQIWILLIDNPPVNALNFALFDEIESVIDRFSLDAEAKVMILSSANERIFSSGADINEIILISSPDEGKAMALRGQRLCNKIENMNKPVIAAINGLCIGGGNEIAMACHLRIVSDKAKFGQPEVNLGIIPGFGGTQRLTRLIGASWARQLILTGDLISAQKALELKLADIVVPAQDVLLSAMDLAKRIIRNSKICIEMAQKAIREGLRSSSFEEGLKIEIECFRRVCESEDMKEGLRAYKEKRAPNFKDK